MGYTDDDVYDYASRDDSDDYYSPASTSAPYNIEEEGSITSPIELSEGYESETFTEDLSFQPPAVRDIEYYKELGIPPPPDVMEAYLQKQEEIEEEEIEEILPTIIPGETRIFKSPALNRAVELTSVLIQNSRSASDKTKKQKWEKLGSQLKLRFQNGRSYKLNERGDTYTYSGLNSKRFRDTYTKYNVEPKTAEPLDMESVERFDDEHLAQLLKHIMTDPYASALVKDLLAHIMGSGITLVFTGLSKQIDMSTLSSKFSSEELMPFFLDWFMCQMSWGFCVYGSKPSKHLKGWKAPVVIRKKAWTAQMGYVDNEQAFNIFKQMIPNETSKTTNTQVYSGGDGAQRGQGKIYEGAFVSVLFPPMDDTTLTAPYAILAKKFDLLRGFWDNIKTATDKNANVDYVVETGVGGKSSGSVLLGTGTGNRGQAFDPAHAMYNEGDVTDAFREASMIENEQERQLFWFNTQLIRLVNKGIVSLNNPDLNRRAKDEMERNENRSKTLQNTIMLSKGQKITSPPEAKLSPQMPEYINMLLTLICANFGVNAESLNMSGNIHAANAELSLRMLNASIKQFQNRIAPQLVQIFENIWKDELEQLRSEEAAGLSKILFDTATSPSDLSAGGPKTDGSQAFRKAIRDIDKLSGAIDSNIEGPNKKLQRKTNNRAVDMIKSLIQEGVKEEIRIEVKFNQTPLTSPERLREMRELAVITHETFAEHMLAVNGLPPSDLAPEEFRNKFVKYEEDMKKADLDTRKNAAKGKMMAGPGQKSATPEKPKPKEKEKEKDSDSVTGKKRKRDDDSSPSDKVNVTGSSAEENRNKKRKTEGSALERAEKKREAVAKRAE